MKHPVFHTIVTRISQFEVMCMYMPKKPVSSEKFNKHIIEPHRGVLKGRGVHGGPAPHKIWTFIFLSRQN